MKKVFGFLTVFVIVLALVSLLIRQKQPESVSPEPFQEASITPSISLSPTFNPPNNLTSKDYKIQWIIVRDLKKIILLSNLEDKLPSKEALVKNACLYLVSGGFWSDENGHLGLLISDGEQKSDAIKSDLLNGYLTITQDNRATISRSASSNPTVRLALQSGPIVFLNGKPTTLSLIRDENARRIVVATTTNNEVIFLVVYYQASPLLGPTLVELPEILENIKKNTSLEFKDALNLDGGTHSAYLTDFLSLTEVARFGSFFCVKP